MWPLARLILQQYVGATRTGGGKFLVNRTASKYSAGGAPQPTANDVPMPQGDWKEWHSKQNGRYNAILISGIVVLLTAISVTHSTGVIVWNYKPPHLDDDELKEIAKPPPPPPDKNKK